MRRLHKAALLAAALASSAANASDVQERIVQSILGRAAVASAPGPRAETTSRYQERLAAAISPQGAPKQTRLDRLPRAASNTQRCPAAAITGA